MSIIQKIRDKGSWVMVSLLVLALISFIFMDAKTSLFGGGDNPTIGTINGTKIKKQEFASRVAALKAAYKDNAQATESAISNAVWQMMTDELSKKGEYSSLLEDLNEQQLSDLAIGKTGFPSQYMTQLFKTSFGEQALDPQSQSLNPQFAEMVLNSAKANASNGELKEFMQNFKSMLPMVKYEILSARFSYLMENTGFVPSWLADKNLNNDKTLTNISFVSVPYSDINDSTEAAVKVSDSDIKNYIDKYPFKFKTVDERDIDYVVFDYNATSNDSLAIKTVVNDGLVKLSTATDSTASNVLASIGSMGGYSKQFVRRSNLYIDTNQSYVAGQIINTFVKENNYVAAKVIDVKNVPDSASARHILIGVGKDKDDVTAKKLMDSVVALYRSGISFDSLAKKYSEDPGSKDSGGLYKSFAFNAMVPEFNDFAFFKNAGDTGVVKTSFGYHFIKAEGTKGASKPAYKVAYIVKPIVPSAATKEKVGGEASSFSATNRTAKAFDEYITKNPSVLKRNGYNIGRLNQQIMGLNGNVTSVVKWAYNNKIKVGDVSEPINLKDLNYYVVAKLVRKQEEGKQTVESVKKNPMLLGLIANDKKYDFIVNKYKSPATLEAAAQATGKTVMTKDSVSFNSGVIPGFANESKAIGYAFSKDAVAKVSGPIKGTSGVFYVKANVAPYQNASVTTDVNMFKKQELQKLQDEYRVYYETYTKDAKIKDRRLENGL